MAANPDWKALSIQIPGQDALEGARKALEALVVYLEVLKTILETVKIFMVDIGNPVKPIVEGLLQIVLDLFESLRRTGVYGWYDLPDPLKDPNFNHFVGGFPAFVTRFKAGLRDPRDPNRPQPIQGATKSGFTMIVADAETVLGLLKYLKVLQRFLGKEFVTPQYPAPASFKVLPVGKQGDLILGLAKLIEDQPTSVAVEWALPPVALPGDPGFSDLIQGMSQTFTPPKFLIEKSSINPAIGEIDAADLSDPDAAGPVVITAPTRFRARGTREIVTRKVRLTDSGHDPFLKFQTYIVVDATRATGTFLLGQLGTFRYIDSDIEPNKVYYYRVRAFSGDLEMSGSSVSFASPETNVIDGNLFIEWPGDVVMGKASPVVPVMIPTYPAKFNVFENLRRIFQVAFSLNFHLQCPVGVTFDGATGLPNGSDPSKHYIDIGKGSLTQLAGALTSFEAVPLIGNAVSGFAAVTAMFQPDPATNKLPDGPWNDSRVLRNASRLAVIVSSAMLQANSAIAFKALMEGPFVKGQPEAEGLGSNLADMVYQLTKVDDVETASQGAVQDAGVLYANAYPDPQVRLNVLAAVEFCKAFTLVGSPPNWIQVSVLRDIAPWSGQVVYELLAKMQALLDAYKGVTAELNAFIDLLVQKVDTLEQFLQYLVSILDFVESLSLGFYILSVPETDGDVTEWASLIDHAGGTRPPSGPGGYTGGVAFAYVASDVTAFASAFKLIF